MHSWIVELLSDIYHLLLFLCLRIWLFPLNLSWHFYKYNKYYTFKWNEYWQEFEYIASVIIIFVLI